MYQQNFFNPDRFNKKRGRDDDDGIPTSEGFSERRTKRPHLALPIRSPERRRNSLHAQRSPSIADITPCGSDSEDVIPKSILKNTSQHHFQEPRSYFSPWSTPQSLGALSNLPSSQILTSPAFFKGRSSIDDSMDLGSEMDIGESMVHSPGSSDVRDFAYTTRSDLASVYETAGSSNDGDRSMSSSHNSLDRLIESYILNDSGNPSTPLNRFSPEIPHRRDVWPHSRIPTPIRPQFSIHSRNNSDLSIVLSPGSDDYNYSFSGDNLHNRRGNDIPADRTIHRNRDRNYWPGRSMQRLPSPISEGDGDLSSSPRYGFHPFNTEYQSGQNIMEDVVAETQIEAGMDVEVIEPLQDLSMQNAQLLSQQETPRNFTILLTTTTELAVAEPPKKGHIRNKHWIHGGRLSDLFGDTNGSGNASGSFSSPQGVKRGYVLGYRNDCEKCRMKVPGHFSHVVNY